MKKICFVATIPAVVNSFLKEHIQASSQSWLVKIISNSVGAELVTYQESQFIPLPIERKISPWSDLLALVQMVILFRREQFDLIHSIMPKTGLLAMLAGCLAGVPHRIHTFTGQVWANKKGFKRSLLKMFDKLIVLFATHILVDSPSQRDFLVSEGVLHQGKGIVIGHGSICGINEAQFHTDNKAKNTVRADLKITLDQTVILFLGRLNRDKGILDLATVFTDIASIRTDVLLVLVGAEEDVTFTQVQNLCGVHHERLRRVSFTTNPEHYMAAADIFCLPSYREGFGQVIIEAAACGVPTVASRIYGITDAVEEGKTGLLYASGDVTALKQSLLTLIDDPLARQNMGEAARLRALELFPSHKITAGVHALYTELLAQH